MPTYKPQKTIKRKAKKEKIKSYGKGKHEGLTTAPKKRKVKSMREIEKDKAMKKAAERRAKRNVASTGNKTTRKES